MCGCGDLKYAPKTHNHSQYVTTKALNQALGAYLTGEEVLDYLAANYYTKSEVDDLLTALQDQIDALQAQSEPIGTIKIWPSDTIPSDYLACRGQPLSTATYPDLFALIGYTFGGAGSSFSLPNLMGRFPVGLNTADGQMDTIGETGGESVHILTVAEIPTHAHDITVQYRDSGALDAGTGPVIIPRVSGTAGTNYTKTTVSTGSGDPHNNMPPFLTVNFIIRVQ